MAIEVHIWEIPQRANEEDDRLGSRGWCRKTVTPEAGEDCERLEQDNGQCRKGPYAQRWMRMLESAESESKSLRSC